MNFGKNYIALQDLDISEKSESSFSSLDCYKENYNKPGMKQLTIIKPVSIFENSKLSKQIEKSKLENNYLTPFLSKK